MLQKTKKVTAEIGGQAIIEGILIRNKDRIAIAVRTEKGRIIIKKEQIDFISNKYPILRLPVLRGVVAFFQTLVIGIKALVYSANIATGEKQERLNFWEVAGIISLSLCFGIGLFVLVPYVVTIILGYDERTAPIAFNLVDGGIKILIFMLYVLIIGYFNDVRRVFQYHGAEHMAVNCYESEKRLKRLTIENVKKFSTLHPRCGTSFIMIVLIIGIFILSLIGPLTIFLVPNFSFLPFFSQKIILFFFRLLFLLPIAGISYELLKLAGKYRENKILHIVNAPGMLIQKLTTQKPDEKMIEVAIRALKAVVD